MNMHIALVMVMSADGKITHGEDPSVQSWSSVEDFQHFQSIKTSFSVLVMGSATYEAAKKQLRPSPTMRRIVLTSAPDRYSDDTIPGQVEFTDESPERLVSRLNDEHVGAVLVTGGSQVNKAFFAAHLIDELILTVEPIILGSGLPLLAPLRIRQPLTLTSVDRLNEQGTLVLRYTVNHEHTRD